MNKSINSILEERLQQDNKWGQQNHSPEWWLAILGEEFGELSKEILEVHFSNKSSLNLRKELVQVAAVALAMLECCDRNNWSKND